MTSNPFAHSLTDVLINQTPEFLGLYDPVQGWFTRVNPAGALLLGYASAEDFLAEPTRTLQTPRFSAANWDALREQARRHGRQDAETKIDYPAGRAFQARVELTYFEEHGVPLFLVRITPQSRLHQVEHELAQSVRRYEAVFANATIGILVCDRAGTIVSANQMAHQQFGYPPTALTGQSLDTLVPNATSQPPAQRRKPFNGQPPVQTASAAHRDLEGQRLDGAVFPAEVSLSYFHLDAAPYTVAYVLDISLKKQADHDLIAQRQRVERLNADLEQKVTDRTHALTNTLEQLELHQDELAKALAAEQELGELKSRFVSLASHEFRTPLTAVLTSAELIADYSTTEQQPQRLRHLARISQSVTHLNDILEEFLSVGRIEEGMVVASPAPVNLPALLLDAVANVASLLKTGQTIAQHVQADNLLWLDPSLLRKILVNLLSNAVKYSGENSLVQVRATCAANQLTLIVQDQGVGISVAEQAHLFERFFRARNVGYVPGTGLGLYITAKYLELMDGTIALHSTLEVGTTVTVVIPYANPPVD